MTTPKPKEEPTGLVETAKFRVAMKTGTLSPDWAFSGFRKRREAHVLTLLNHKRHMTARVLIENNQVQDHIEITRTPE